MNRQQRLGSIVTVASMEGLGNSGVGFVVFALFDGLLQIQGGFRNEE